MPYSETITQRVRERLRMLPTVDEKKMFGGIVFMVNDKMCVCVGGSDPDNVMVRIGPERYQEALDRPGATPTIMQGRAIEGYVDLGDAAQEDLDFWIDSALAFNAELVQPPH